MKVNIYLPDDLGARAKADGLPLSQMLQQAVRDYYQEAQAMATTLSSAREIILDLADDNGGRYKGRFTGTPIGSDDRRSVYLLEDGRVLLYDEDNLSYHDISDNVEQELEALERSAYIDAMTALGLEPVVDL